MSQADRDRQESMALLKMITERAGNKPPPPPPADRGRGRWNTRDMKTRREHRRKKN